MDSLQPERSLQIRIDGLNEKVKTSLEDHDQMLDVISEPAL